MDARSIAATAANKGYLTPATDIDVEFTGPKYHFDKSIYENRVFDSKGEADPNSGDTVWSEYQRLAKDGNCLRILLLKLYQEIHHPVTTTDELIPSGIHLLSVLNPLGLAEFALSRKYSAYVGKSKGSSESRESKRRRNVRGEALPELKPVMEKIKESYDVDSETVWSRKYVFAVKPGDGSAREQAASCQKVLGGWANIAYGVCDKEISFKSY